VIRRDRFKVTSPCFDLLTTASLQQYWHHRATADAAILFRPSWSAAETVTESFRIRTIYWLWVPQLC
jgi:hypothetical protein